MSKTCSPLAGLPYFLIMSSHFLSLQLIRWYRWRPDAPKIPNDAVIQLLELSDIYFCKDARDYAVHHLQHQHYSLDPTQLIFIFFLLFWSTILKHSCHMLSNNLFWLAPMISQMMNIACRFCRMEHNDKSQGMLGCTWSDHCMWSPAYGTCRNLHEVKEMWGGLEAALVEQNGSVFTGRAKSITLQGCCWMFRETQYQRDKLGLLESHGIHCQEPKCFQSRAKPHRSQLTS